MYTLIITTTNDMKIAQNIAKILTDKEYSPCVQILNNLNSIYKWKGKIINESEISLHIKTKKAFIDKVSKIIKDNHNYEVPEIIMFDFNIIGDDYSKWFNNNISRS